MKSFLSHLECSRCSKTFGSNQLQTLCPDCVRPLLVKYDLKSAKNSLSPKTWLGREWNLWRYRELLPESDDTAIVSLGEGCTPVLQAHRLGNQLGLSQLYLKDEGKNPTGSFKSRGMSVAVTMAKKLGTKQLFAPSAGNAGVAMAAYGARAGLPVSVAYPEGTPAKIIENTRGYGAEVLTVKGSIADAGKLIRERMAGRQAFDLSTFREPYRVEGKKTMGFELFEQFEGNLPDVILYPLGGGTGLVALEKAFAEMEELGWVGKKHPRLFAVQAEGCAPIVNAFEKNAEFAEAIPNPLTQAHGLRVPATLADFLILRAIRKTNGGAISVSENEIEAAVSQLAQSEGIYAAPEAAATLAALSKLLANGSIRKEESILLLLTASASVY